MYNNKIFNRRLVEVNLNNLATYEKALQNLDNLDNEKLYSRKDLQRILNLKTQDFTQKELVGGYESIHRTPFIPTKVEEKTILVKDPYTDETKSVKVRTYFYSLSCVKDILTSHIKFSKQALKEICDTYASQNINWDRIINYYQTSKNLHTKAKELIKTWN